MPTGLPQVSGGISLLGALDSAPASTASELHRARGAVTLHFTMHARASVLTVHKIVTDRNWDRTVTVLQCVICCDINQNVIPLDLYSEPEG
jgi:hypothetical protein